MAEQLPWYRRLRRRAYWLLLLFLLWVADHLPLTWGRRFFSSLAIMALKVRPRERARALANLQWAFPDISTSARGSLLEECARLLGLNFFDALAAKRVLSCRLVSEEGPDCLMDEVKRVAAQGRGVLFLTGHLGSWELLGAWLGQQVSSAGLGQLGVVTGTLHNAPINQVVQQRRQDTGLVVLPRQEGARPLLAHLKKGQPVAILVDQKTSANSRKVPFWGRPAETPTGLAQLALKYGIPVVPVGIAFDGKSHKVQWLPAVESAPAAVPVSENELNGFLALCNCRLEDLIRRNPAQWVWFHDRWG